METIDSLFNRPAYEYDQYGQISLKYTRDLIFLTENNREELCLQRQFSDLECYCCHAGLVRR
jgi:hypothetical protein